jgi:hypothetical protein
MCKNHELHKQGFDYAMVKIDLYWEIICMLDRWLAWETKHPINYWKNEAFSIAEGTPKANKMLDELQEKIRQTNGI